MAVGVVVVALALGAFFWRPGRGEDRARLIAGLDYVRKARQAWSTPDGQPRGALGIDSAEAHVELVHKGSVALQSWRRGLRDRDRELVAAFEREEEIGRDVEFGLQAIAPLRAGIETELERVRQGRAQAGQRLAPDAEAEDLDEAAHRLEDLLADLEAARRSVRQMAAPDAPALPGRGEQYRVALLGGLELDLEQEKVGTERSLEAVRKAKELLTAHLLHSRELLDQVDQRVALLAASFQELGQHTADAARVAQLLDRVAQNNALQDLAALLKVLAAVQPEIPDPASFLKNLRFTCGIIVSLDQEARKSAAPLTALTAASRAFQVQGIRARGQLLAVHGRLPPAVAALSSVAARMDELTQAASPARTLWSGLLDAMKARADDPWREPVSTLVRITQEVTDEEHDIEDLPARLAELQRCEREYLDRLAALRSHFRA